MKIITYESRDSAISEKFYSEINRICNLADRTPVAFERAGFELRRALEAWDGNESLLLLVAEIVKDTTETRVVISVSGNDEKFKNHCIQEAGHAAWGCCLSRTVAVNYAPESSALVTQVHETLHLLGVEECYEEHVSGHPPKKSCDNEQCVMRYGSESTAVCNSVLEQLRKNVG